MKSRQPRASKEKATVLGSLPIFARRHYILYYSFKRENLITSLKDGGKPHTNYLHNKFAYIGGLNVFSNDLSKLNLQSNGF